MAPPIYVKGGQWTNVEDQILRAAVSKYGLTQWARVASLLPKKTAKQAKARWNEYLSPTIRREDWSLEEDEKLLSLAKLLPNQWRSIAPIMGRTPTQCVERYQKLLDKALGAVDDDEETEEFGLSGPGIETLPALGNAYESMPSRPDMEDMDEDEQEMLSEAKARLANTLGKKAKRKERERMLQENRRITLLEKRRDLKASGVRVSLELKNKKRRKEFDYNADIPHERAPPPGLYDTSAEDAANERERLAFQEQVRHKGIVPDEKKKSSKNTTAKSNKRQRQEISDAAKLFSDVADQEVKRRKLDLPPPSAQEPDHLIGGHEMIRGRSLSPSDQSQLGSSRERGSGHRSLDKALLRKFQKLMQSMFLKIPPPKNKIEHNFPNLGKGLEELEDSDMEEHPESPESPANYELEPFEPQKSLVVLQGLAIPHPEKLKEVTKPEHSEVELAIASEFKKLVKSDYKQYVDLTYNAELVDPLDPAALLAVQEEIEKEKEANISETAAISKYSLPKSEAVVGQVMQALQDLYESSNTLDQKLNERASSYHEALGKKYDKIYNLALQLEDAVVNEKLLGKVAELEAQAVEERSSNLHEFVETIEMAKAECRMD